MCFSDLEDVKFFFVFLNKGTMKPCLCSIEQSYGFLITMYYVPIVFIPSTKNNHEMQRTEKRINSVILING